MRRKIRGKKKVWVLILAAVLMVGVFPHMAARADEEPAPEPWLAFAFQGYGWHDEGEDEEPGFVYEGFGTHSEWLVEDAENKGCYHKSDDPEAKADAPVIWDYETRTLTLRDYNVDFSKEGEEGEDGIVPALICPENLKDFTIRVIGKCSISYNGTIIGIGLDCDKLSIVKGSDDAELTLTSSGTDGSAPEGEIWPYCPIAFWGTEDLANDVTFENQVVLNLTAKDKVNESDWDIEVNVTEPESFITNTGTISGNLPEPESGEISCEDIQIDPNGYLHGDPEAPAYWKAAETDCLVEAGADDYQIYYDAETRTLELKDCNFAGTKGLTIYSECSLNLVLKGTNRISSSADSAFAVEKDLSVSGDGSLTVVTTCKYAEIKDDDGTVIETYVPVAMWVDGEAFSNSSTLTCEASEDAEADFRLGHVNLADIQNTGKIYGRYLTADDQTGKDLIYQAPEEEQKPEQKPSDSKPSDQPGGSGSSDASPTPVLGTSETEKAVADIGKAADRSKVTVVMKTDDGKTATIVPKEVLAAAKEKDVTVVLQMDGYSWTINGKDIKAATSDIDLKVTLNSAAIPEKSVKDFANGKKTVLLSLAHNGDFGFTAVLNLSVGKENQGRYGNLYCYQNGKFEYVSDGKINADGSISLSFQHASDYVILIDDKSLAPKTADSGMAGICLLGLLLASGACLAGYMGIRRRHA